MIFVFAGRAGAQAPAPAPGPSGAYGCYTALNVLEANGRYNTFLSLLDSTNLGSYFDDPTRFVTIFAPTDAGIQQELRSLGTSVANLANSTSAVQDILEYHILPSPVLVPTSGPYYTYLWQYFMQCRVAFIIQVVLFHASLVASASMHHFWFLHDLHLSSACVM